MNTLRFEVDTDASYSSDEIEELQDAFISWVTGIDPDADADTADVRIVTPGDTKSAEFVEMLDNATFEVKLKVDTGDVAFETTLK